MLNQVRIGHGGLQSLTMTVAQFQFGNGVLTAQKLSMSYSKDSRALHFRGDALLDALGYEVKGKFDLQVDTSGHFRGGSVKFVAPKSFELVKGRAVLTNPELWANWTEEETGLGIRGDLDFNLGPKLAFQSKQTSIEYSTVEGFVGKVEKLGLTIPVHEDGNLHFILVDVVIDKHGFKAGKVSLIYAYGDDDGAKDKPPVAALQPGSKPPAPDLAAMVPGFNVNWIKAAGLETLVVDLSATKVAIGPEGINVGKYSKEVTKFRAKLFGLDAEFDGNKGTGKIKGSFKRDVKLPALAIKFPLLIPGLNASFGLRADVGFGATFDATLKRLVADATNPNIRAWQLSNTADLTAHAGIQIYAGLTAGIPYIAEIEASFFAEAHGDVGLKANVTGTVLWNDATNQLSLPESIEDKPSAELIGSVKLSAKAGAQVRGQLFHVFEAEIWKCTFVEWNLGDWALSAKLSANAQGDYDITTTNAGFGGAGGVPKTEPIVEKTRVSATTVIDDCIKANKTIDDPHKMRRLVHELTDSQAAAPPDKKVYFPRLKQINGTALNLDVIDAELLGAIGQRSKGSLLMSSAEWLVYSTTAKLTSNDPTVRDTIRPVDADVAAYHAEPLLPQRKVILNRLITERIPAYTRQLVAGRQEMAEKLWTDAKRELARINLL